MAERSPTREERSLELARLMLTEPQAFKLILEQSLPAGTRAPVGTLSIDIILEHEYGQKAGSLSPE